MHHKKLWFKNALLRFFSNLMKIPRLKREEGFVFEGSTFSFLVHLNLAIAKSTQNKSLLFTEQKLRCQGVDFTKLCAPSESCGLVGRRRLTIVGSNPLTGILDGCGVKVTQV